MDLIAGCKETDIGPLPRDWDLVHLGALIQYAEYGSSAASKPKGVMPVLRMGNLQEGKIDWEDLVYTSNPAEIRRYSLAPGDVLFNRTNTAELVGKTSIYEGERPAIFAGYLIRIVPRPDRLDARYLNYIMNTELARRHSAKVLSVAVSQANINAQKLRTYPIPLPPTVGEQRAIAAALSDVDNLLAALDRLIAKKRDLKQAAMQQLFTGKVRLPGFRGVWSSTTIFGLASRDKALFDDGDWIEAEYLEESGIRLVQTGNIGVGTFEEKRARKYISARSFADLRCKDVVVGDLLICRLAEPAGRACVMPDIGEPRMITSVDVTIFRPPIDVADRRFLQQLFSTTGWLRSVADRCGGSTRSRISRGELGKIEVRIPAVYEQVAIADALSDMDAELAALEQRRDKTRLLKQAMMQELLTGRTRLV
ncbi:restriction endonuclease subunit S [bacterium]|nr:MAG: restriction endonuclease subunit S [bacterium]